MIVAVNSRYLAYGENGEVIQADAFGRKFVVANGWVIRETKNGGVRCEATREYSDGEHSIVFSLQKGGKAQVVRKTPAWRCRKLERFERIEGESLIRLEKPTIFDGGLNGTLVLSGGKIDERYARFRTTRFEEFLKEFGITQVVRPNRDRWLFDEDGGRYTLEQTFHEYFQCTRGDRYKKVVATDGIVEESYGDFDVDEYGREYGCDHRILVKGFTYLILKDYDCHCDSHSSAVTLYTALSPEEFRRVYAETSSR